VSPVFRVTLVCPDWVEELDWTTPRQSDEARMALAIEISRRNVAEKTGGPFGSAIFDKSGALVSVGMNLVVGAHNSTAHGEMVAFQLAGARRETHRLGGLELFTSCEPCAMCLGATLWSGVDRVVCAATGEDARAIGFDEGPVFDASWKYLEDRGVRTVRGVMRDEAKRVLDDYLTHGGVIYNR